MRQVDALFAKLEHCEEHTLAACEGPVPDIYAAIKGANDAAVQTAWSAGAHTALEHQCTEVRLQRATRLAQEATQSTMVALQHTSMDLDLDQLEAATGELAAAIDAGVAVGIVGAESEPHASVLKKAKTVLEEYSQSILRLSNATRRVQQLMFRGLGVRAEANEAAKELRVAIDLAVKKELPEAMLSNARALLAPMYALRPDGLGLSLMAPSLCHSPANLYTDVQSSGYGRRLPVPPAPSAGPRSPRRLEETLVYHTCQDLTTGTHVAEANGSHSPAPIQGADQHSQPHGRARAAWFAV